MRTSASASRACSRSRNGCVVVMPLGAEPGKRPLRLPTLRSERSAAARSEEHTSELQSLMRISYAVFCLKKKKNKKSTLHNIQPEMYARTKKNAVQQTEI